MHACAYLLTVDVDMEPLPGYRLASWSTGYQDMHAACDLTTLRRIPWLEKTALVLCDLEAWSYDDAARALDCSPGTIRSRLHRARRLLVAKLQAERTATSRAAGGRR